MGIAYLARNLLTGKGYIGVTTKTLARRWAAHRAAARGDAQTALARAIRKYGVENFSVVQIASCLDVSHLAELEKTLIIREQTRNPLGYNLTDGGDGSPGFTHTPEARLKISVAGRGRTHSTQTRQRMRERHLGKILSAEHRAKLAASKLGKKLPRRPEHQAKINASRQKTFARRYELLQRERTASSRLAAGIDFREVDSAGNSGRTQYCRHQTR